MLESYLKHVTAAHGFKNNIFEKIPIWKQQELTLQIDYEVVKQNERILTSIQKHVNFHCSNMQQLKLAIICMELLSVPR